MSDKDQPRQSDWQAQLFGQTTEPAAAQPPTADDLTSTAPAPEAATEKADQVNPVLAGFLGGMVAAAVIGLIAVILKLPLLTNSWQTPSVASLAGAGFVLGAAYMLLHSGLAAATTAAKEWLIGLLHVATALIVGCAAAVTGIVWYGQLVVNDRWWRTVLIGSLWLALFGVGSLLIMRHRYKNRPMDYHRKIKVYHARNFARPPTLSIPALQSLSEAIGEWRIRNFKVLLTADETEIKYFAFLHWVFKFIGRGATVPLLVLLIWCYMRAPYGRRLFRFINSGGWVGWTFFGIAAALVLLWFGSGVIYLAVKRAPAQRLKQLQEQIKLVVVFNRFLTGVVLFIVIAVWALLKFPWAAWFLEHLKHDQQRLLIIVILPLLALDGLIWKSLSDIFLMHSDKYVRGGSKFTVMRQNSISRVPNSARSNLEIRGSLGGAIFGYGVLERKTSANGEEEWDAVIAPHPKAFEESTEETSQP